MQSKQRRPSIKIIHSFDCIDLRKITSQSYFLQDQIKNFKMKHLDAILYSNQALTRFRLVLNVRGLGLLCIPEIDEASKHSLYLRISEKLAELSGVSAVLGNISDIRNKIKERVDRQEERSRKDAEATKPVLRAVS